MRWGTLFHHQKLFYSTLVENTTFSRVYKPGHLEFQFILVIFGPAHNRQREMSCCCICVDTSQRAVIQKFGKYSFTAGPGLTFILWPVATASLVSVKVHHKQTQSSHDGFSFFAKSCQVGQLLLVIGREFYLFFGRPKHLLHLNQNQPYPLPFVR